MIQALLIPLAVAAVDGFLGVVLAVKTGGWRSLSLKKFGHDIETTVLPYIGATVLMYVPQAMQTNGTTSSQALAAALIIVASKATLKLASDAVDKLGALAGKPIPVDPS